MKKVYIVWACWDLESCLPLVGFEHEEEADALVKKCEEFQLTEPEDGLDEWEENHPGKEYITSADHLSGVDSFYAAPLIVKQRKCPKCGSEAEQDHNSFQCHKCKMLWPKST